MRKLLFCMLRTQQGSLAPLVLGMFNAAILIVYSRLESSGLFVDSAFPHATPWVWAEEAEADDVQLFRSPDTRLEGSAFECWLSQATGKQAAKHLIFLEQTATCKHIPRHHYACRQTSM
jgi:hypothetical protein